MMPKRALHCVSVGEAPHKRKKGFETETIKFTIHDFKGQKEYRIESPIVRAHGHDWSVMFYRNDPDDPEDVDMECYLFLIPRSDDDEVTASLNFRCKDIRWREEQCKFDRHSRDYGSAYFLDRDHLDKYLEDDGSLVIECDIEVDRPRSWYTDKFQPQSLLADLYQAASPETSDAVFSVGQRIFYAHQAILSLRCPKLYEIAKESTSDNETTQPIPIHFVREEIFESMLGFAYTVQTPETMTIKTEQFAKDLLDAADRFEFVPLKLFVESVLADRFLGWENAATLLLFADSHSCALLKEAASQLILSDMKSIEETRDWPRIKESNQLMVELLHEASRKVAFKKNSDPTPTDNVDCLDVTSLREELEQAKIDVDGSREVLVNRWKSLRSQKSSSP